MKRDEDFCEEEKIVASRIGKRIEKNVLFC